MRRLVALLILLTAVNAGGEEPMESDNAEFGSSSSGSSHMSEPEVDRAFEHAMLVANEQKERTLGSERLVHTLLDEETVHKALQSRGIDDQLVRNLLEGHLLQQEKRADGTPLEQDLGLQRALQRMAIRHMVSMKKRISSLDILSAIVEQNDSYAATVLTQQGFTIDEATDAATEHFIEETQRSNEEMGDLRAKIAIDSESENRVSIIRGSAEAEPSSDLGILTYKLRVTSRDPDTQVEFKGATSQDGRLKLLIETTPYEFEFVSTRVVALLEAVGESKGISAKLIVQHEDGSETTAGGFGGESGAIFQDPRGRLAQRKSGRF